MNNQTLQSIAGLLIFFSFSCTSNHRVGKNTYDINPSSSISINASKVFESLEYIPLAEYESSASLLGGIYKLIVADSSFFIMSVSSSSSHLGCFDFLGNFKYSIDRQGEGPDNYKQATDFLIDPTANQLEILDSYGGKILFFNLNNGDYLFSQKIPEIFFVNFAKLSKDTYIYFSSNSQYDTLSYNLHVIKNHTHNIANFFPVQKWEEGFWINAPWLQSFGKEIFFSKPFDFNIYAVDENGYSIYLPLNFGENALILNDGITRGEVRDRLIMENNYVNSIMRVIPLNEKIVFSYSYKFAAYLNVFHRKNNKLIQINQIFNDMDGLKIYNRPVGGFENTLVFVIPSNVIHQHLSYNLPNNLKVDRSNIKDIAHKINPTYESSVLLLAHFKDN